MLAVASFCLCHILQPRASRWASAQSITAAAASMDCSAGHALRQAFKARTRDKRLRMIDASMPATRQAIGRALNARAHHEHIICDMRIMRSRDVTRLV